MLIVSSSSSCCVTCGQLAAVLSSKRALVAEMPPGGQAPEAEQDDNGGPFQEVKGKKGKHKKKPGAEAATGKASASAATPASGAPTCAIGKGAATSDLAPTTSKAAAPTGASQAVKGDGKKGSKGKEADAPNFVPGPPPRAKGGGQVSREDIQDIVAQVIEAMLPDRLATALAQNPQGPRPISQAHQDQPQPTTAWPPLPNAAAPCAASPPQPLLRADAPAWAGKGAPHQWAGARLQMPLAGPGVQGGADGLNCPICQRFVRGGQSALIQHQNSSSTCRAVAGDALFGREPCEFCGKMLAANDEWAQRQHAVYCQAQRQSFQQYEAELPPQNKGRRRSYGKGKGPPYEQMPRWRSPTAWQWQW